MAIAPFLAMTAAEFHKKEDHPDKIAWMACHFSPYGLGLSNLPQWLPPGSLLILDDITPIHGHDPEFILEQLSACTEALSCSGILLDFQRPGADGTARLVQILAAGLPCPVAVSEKYAGDLSCSVILPPLPPSVPLEEYLLPWQGRPVWLELGLDGEILTVTEKGCDASVLPCPDPDSFPFREESLHCHYSIRTDENAARFSLWRTREDLEDLLTEAETLGVAGAVGLYQEFCKNENRPA